MTLLHRFEDDETERAFLRAERTSRGPAIRTLIVIAIVTLLSYIFLNPMHFPPAGVIAYSQASGALILVMVGVFVASRTEYYRDHPWVDLPIFLVVAAGMKALALVLAGQSDFTGFPPHVMVMVQMAILVVFASVGFAGTFRLFLVWAALVLALLAAWLMTRPGVPDIARVYTLTNFITFFVFALYFNWDTERRARTVFRANQALEQERAKTEALLYNVLPQQVAARLRAGQSVADSFSDLTVVFVDMAGFSALSQRLSPGHLVQLLNRFFSAGDACAERNGLEKVKTIGDAYLAVAGGMASVGGDNKAALLFARELVAEVSRIAAETGLQIKVRIGIHTGPAVGGVIGSSRLAYDYWGDTMNIASRLESIAPLNGVAVSEATYLQTRMLQDYVEQPVVLKGIGEARAYTAVLEGREE